MDEKGVFAVARSVWDSANFSGDEYSMREAWLWLISSAAWKPITVRGEGGAVNLQRGEFLFSVRFLAEKWNWSKSRVARALKTFEKRDMIRDTSRDKSAVYSINRYNEFQVIGLPKRDSKRDADRDSSGTAAGQQRDKEETLQTLETKKVSKEPPPAGPKPEADSKLPSWLPLGPWSAFLEMRRKKRAVPTQHAVDLILKDLDRWRQRGHDPTEILNASTKSNWTDVYEPKAGKNGQRNGGKDGKSALDTQLAGIADGLAQMGGSNFGPPVSEGADEARDISRPAGGVRAIGHKGHA